MAISSRKSLGPALRFEISEMTPSVSSPSGRRRSLAAPKIIDMNIEENDDEAEKLARREKNESGSPVLSILSSNDRRQSTVGLAYISNLSSVEMSNQIAQCIKLSAENKINDKNAFQLKMIDFLVYALKKQDPNMTNLQMASASLDASAKIYGFRVDKVHSDLLKIIGMAKQDKRNFNVEESNEIVGNLEQKKKEGQLRKRKKKNQEHIISAVECLKGNIEIYDPLSLIRCQRDTQTSDMLFQAGLPQHSNQGVTLNLYNDVILDLVPIKNLFFRTLTLVIDNFENYRFCNSYAAFKFNDWSPDHDLEEIHSKEEDNDGKFHFDLDADVLDNDSGNYDAVIDNVNMYETHDRLAPTNLEKIVDFQDMIANNPNPNVTYEYSYLQKSYRIHWAGPSHWKITINKNINISKIIESCKQNSKKNKKEIKLSFTLESKKNTKTKFSLINRQTKLSAKTTKSIWSEDKVTFPQEMLHNIKNYYIYFSKPTENLKFTRGSNDKVFDDDSFTNNNLSFEIQDDNLANMNSSDLIYNIDIESDTGNVPFTQTQSQGALIGDNLVAAPKLTDKIFIPYSQRAKKIDMRQLKKVMWKNLKTISKDNEKENFDVAQNIENENNPKLKSKNFSDVYLQIPKILSKSNAESLSPGIAFVSLLHLANEKNFKIEVGNDLSDLNIQECIKA